MNKAEHHAGVAETSPKFSQDEPYATHVSSNSRPRTQIKKGEVSEMEIFVNKGTRFRCLYSHPDWIADRDYYEDDWKAIGGTLFLFGPEIKCGECAKSAFNWGWRSGMCQEDLLKFMTKHDKAIRRLRRKHWSGFHANLGVMFAAQFYRIQLNRTSMVQSLDIGDGYVIEFNVGGESTRDSMGWVIKPNCDYIFKNGHLVGTAGPIGATILKSVKHEFKAKCKALWAETFPEEEIIPRLKKLRNAIHSKTIMSRGLMWVHLGTHRFLVKRRED